MGGKTGRSRGGRLRANSDLSARKSYTVARRAVNARLALHFEVGYALDGDLDRSREGWLICSSCGTENPAGTKFCIECAARLLQACPACDTANLPTAKFCGECAAPLRAAAPSSAAGRPAAAPAAAPIAERRVVSVLFADLVGFTTLAEGRDPEETRELLSRYFQLATEVEPAIGEAREILARLRAAPLLGHLEAAVGQGAPAATS